MDLWSDVWPAILLEEGEKASIKRSQNGLKIGTRDKFATRLRQETSISNEIVIYKFFVRSAIFPYNSLYTQAVACCRL